MAEVSWCLVVDEGSGGVAGVETEAVPGTIGRCAVEEMIDALVAWDSVGHCDESDGREGKAETLKCEGLCVGGQVVEGAD